MDGTPLACLLYFLGRFFDYMDIQPHAHGMLLVMTMSWMLSAGPERVGLLVIDRQAAAAGPALAQAARAQVAKVAEEAIIDLRIAKRSVACNLDTFRALGVDTALCGVSLPKTLHKLYVVESELRNGKVELTLAVFGRSDLTMLEKLPARRVAVDSSETYAAVMSAVR